jgi:hypothetical protein
MAHGVETAPVWEVRSAERGKGSRGHPFPPVRRRRHRSAGEVVTPAAVEQDRLVDGCPRAPATSWAFSAAQVRLRLRPSFAGRGF